MNDEYERKPNFTSTYTSIDPWEINKGPVKTLIDRFVICGCGDRKRRKKERRKTHQDD